MATKFEIGTTVSLQLPNTNSYFLGKIIKRGYIIVEYEYIAFFKSLGKELSIFWDNSEQQWFFTGSSLVWLENWLGMNGKRNIPLFKGEEKNKLSDLKIILNRAIKGYIAYDHDPDIVTNFIRDLLDINKVEDLFKAIKSLPQSMSNYFLIFILQNYKL